MKPIVRLQTIVSDNPASAHGGLVAHITFMLHVNGDLVLSDNTRVRWEDRNKPRECKEHIEIIADRLATALHVELLT